MDAKFIYKKKYGYMAQRFVIVIGMLLLVSCCTDSQQLQDAAVQDIDHPRFDSLVFTRLGKPHYEDLGNYPLEKLSMSLENGNSLYSRNDTVLSRFTLDSEDIDRVDDLLSQVRATSRNQIYNSNMFWNVELELRVFCQREENNFAIKSFSQFGEVPTEVLEVYQPLLQKMAEAFTQSTQNKSNTVN